MNQNFGNEIFDSNLIDFFKNDNGSVLFGGSYIEANYKVSIEFKFKISPCHILKNLNTEALTNFERINISETIRDFNINDDYLVQNNNINKQCLDLLDKFGFDSKLELALLYETDYQDVYNKNLGYIRRVKEKYLQFDPKKETVNIKIRLIKYEMTTDYGLIYSFGSKLNSTFYRKEVVLEKMLIIQDEEYGHDYSISYDFDLDDKIYYIQRSYNKIDSILANSFSIIQIFISIGKFITYFLNKHSIEYEIINNLYYNSNNSNFKTNKI